MGLKKDEDAILANLYDSEPWKIFRKRFIDEDRMKIAVSALAMLDSDDKPSTTMLARQQGSARALKHIDDAMRDLFTKQHKS